MSYQALARKYRPQSFDDVVGQETVVRTLQNAIEQNRIHHAYLFSGVRGVGKTTSARILAKALNCVHGPTIEPCNECSICREITEGIDMDVREIDAATYTGVDNVRELRDVTQFQPARDRYRIFIIDEAHMLSGASWNALLKLIEEPPPHVVFMFATTEMNKVPPTILSRVQKFALRKITFDELLGRLQKISEAEDIKADRAALEIIARRGEGSVRDAVSLLDQIIAFSGRSITAADVATVLGLSESNFFARLSELIAAGDHSGVVEALDEAAGAGRDLKMLYRDFMSFIRNLLLISAGANESLVPVSPEDLLVLRAAAGKFSYSELLRVANLLLRDDETVTRAEHQRLAVEVALLKAATFPRLRSVEEVLGGNSGASPPVPRTRSVAGSQAVSAVASRARPDEPPRPAMNEKRSRASSSSSRAATSEEPRRDDASGAPPGDAQALVARVQSSRPLIGTYLAGAKTARKTGNRITFVFEPAQSFYAESLTEQVQALEELAADVYGEPVKIDIQTEGAEPRPDAGETKKSGDSQKAAVREDPVVKAFQKHLGGEVVETRKR